MPLSGTFDILDFTDVLRLVAREQLTGKLHLRNRSFGANLFFEDGQLVGADQSEHQAAAAAGDVRGRLEEICFELLEAERGGFEFQMGKAMAVPSAPRLEVDEVLTRASKRLQEWHEMQAVIPTLDLQPHLVLELDRSEVTLDRERWRLLTAIDGRRNLRAIGRVLNLSDFDVCRLTLSLLEAGIIELDGQAAAVAFASVGPDADAPPLTEVVTTANGKQAIKAASPAQTVERVRKRAGALAAKGGADAEDAPGADDADDDDDDGAEAAEDGAEPIERVRKVAGDEAQTAGSPQPPAGGAGGEEAAETDGQVPGGADDDDPTLAVEVVTAALPAAGTPRGDEDHETAGADAAAESGRHRRVVRIRSKLPKRGSPEPT